MKPLIWINKTLKFELSLLLKTIKLTEQHLTGKKNDRLFPQKSPF